jgi:leader peptidase (prepilin peptidase)/N-methyltransferase
MGDGDVELSLLVGLLLGWPKAPIGILSSFVIGALVSVVLILMSRKKMTSTIPFGPFMITGVVVALLSGNILIRFLGFY